MAGIAPLQILVFRHPTDIDTEGYQDAIVRAFQGGKEAGGYVGSGEDLGIQLEVFSGAPSSKVSETLDAFLHTLTVVLVDHALLEKAPAALWDWLAECWTHTTGSNGRHAMLAVPMDERVGRQFSTKRTSLAALQRLEVSDLGEYPIRAAMLALRLLHECRVLLARALPVADGTKAGYLRLFISHAKIDGLPLAHALRHQIEALGWLEKFYDVDDLPAGCDWTKELESGVGSSLIVMLRSDVYDSRPWCQQEVYWADEYATPAVLVDARTGLTFPAGTLPFDRVPSVRIPDGNLMRILFLAIREGLRFLHFIRRVEQMKQTGDLPSPVELHTFSLAPSMSALLRTCRAMASSPTTSIPQLILYPDPPYRAGLYEAAQALVAAHAPRAQLVTPRTLAAMKGAKP